MSLIPVLAITAMTAALLCGIRWPGVLLAGVPFTYQAAGIAKVDWLGEAFVVIATGFALLRFFGEGGKLRPHAIDFALLAVVLWALFATTYAPRPDLAMLHYLPLPITVAGVYGVARFTRPDDRTMVQFLYGVALLGGTLALLLALVPSQRVNRLELETATAVGLAYPLPYVIIASALLFLLSRRLRTQTMALLTLSAGTYAALLSGTRSVFIAAFAALAVVLPIIWTRLPMRTTGKITLAIVAAMIIGPMFFSEQIQPAIDRLTVNFTGGGVSFTDVSSRARQHSYSLAWTMFTERPFMGYGHGSFPQLTPFIYPHNLILETLCEMGVVGFLVLATWLGLVAKALLRFYRQSPLAGVIVMAVAVVGIVQMQLSFTLATGRSLFLVSAVLAHGLNVSRRNQKPPRRRRAGHYGHPTARPG